MLSPRFLYIDLQENPGEDESYNNQYSTSVKRFQYIELMAGGTQNVVGSGRIRNEEERLFAIPIGEKNERQLFSHYRTKERQHQETQLRVDVQDSRCIGSQLRRI